MKIRKQKSKTRGKLLKEKNELRKKIVMKRLIDI